MLNVYSLGRERPHPTVHVLTVSLKYFYIVDVMIVSLYHYVDCLCMLLMSLSETSETEQREQSLPRGRHKGLPMVELCKEVRAEKLTIM